MKQLLAIFILAIALKSNAQDKTKFIFSSKALNATYTAIYVRPDFKAGKSFDFQIVSDSEHYTIKKETNSDTIEITGNKIKYIKIDGELFEIKRKVEINKVNPVDRQAANGSLFNLTVPNNFRAYQNGEWLSIPNTTTPTTGTIIY